MIKVIIVEDNKIIRFSLNALIDGTEGYTCIGNYSNCEELISNIDILNPDVILMDINLPGMSGIEGIKILKDKKPDVNIIILTIYEESNLIFDALFAGASGYLVKGTPPAKILEYIKEATEGGAPMNSHIAKKIINYFHSKKNTKPKTALSDKETHILKCLGEGKTYISIAEELFISKNTVRYHIKNIYKKLHVHSQTEAVAEAIKQGLI